jgi:hypothetical protein
MSVEGMSKASAARVSYVCSATVGRWLERAARTAALLTDRALRDVKATELQGDELRGYARDKERREYVFVTMEVGARLWLSTVVGLRTLRNTRLFVRDTRIAVRSVRSASSS